MIDKILSFAGSTVATINATVATVTQEDARLWLIALVSIVITCLGSYRGKRKANAEAEEAEAKANAERYDAMRKRMETCGFCIRFGCVPQNCVVEPKHRPPKCPLSVKR